MIRANALDKDLRSALPQRNLNACTMLITSCPPSCPSPKGFGQCEAIGRAPLITCLPRSNLLLRCDCGEQALSVPFREEDIALPLSEVQRSVHAAFAVNAPPRPCGRASLAMLSDGSGLELSPFQLTMTPEDTFGPFRFKNLSFSTYTPWSEETLDFFEKPVFEGIWGICRRPHSR